MGAGRRPGRSPNRPPRRGPGRGPGRGPVRGPAPSRNTGTGVGAQHSGFQGLIGGLQQIKRDRDEQRNAASDRHRDGLTIPPRREEFGRDKFNNTVTALRETSNTPQNNERWGTNHFDRDRFNHVVNAVREPERAPVRDTPPPSKSDDYFNRDRFNAVVNAVKRPERGPGKGPGRPGIMPIPDKFRDRDGNPFKQPGRGPKDVQRNAAEDKMRRGGRKGGRR